jgi:hypothetical protein
MEVMHVVPCRVLDPALAVTEYSIEESLLCRVQLQTQVIKKIGSTS